MVRCLLDSIGAACVCGFLALAGIPVSADTDDVINAERPGFSVSPIALSQSRVQIEGGYQYTGDWGREDADDHTAPFLLLRFGLPRELELQIGWSGISWADVAGQNVDGANDASVNLKWQLSESDAALQFALVAGLSIPVGDSEFSSSRVDPSVSAAWSYSGVLDLFGTVLVGDSDGDVSVGNSLGITLPITAAAGAYVEYYGSYFADGGDQHYLNGGFTFLPTNELQLDLYAGFGMNGRADDAFFGFGLAYRF